MTDFMPVGGEGPTDPKFPVACPRCLGDAVILAYYDADEVVACPDCDGLGVIFQDHPTLPLERQCVRAGCDEPEAPGSWLCKKHGAEKWRAHILQDWEDAQ